MMRFAGKNALVTGASRGIGRQIALKLGGEGALVAVHYGANERAAADTVRAIETAGGGAFPVQADLLDRGAVERLARQAIEGFALRSKAASIDILVNNAAIAIAATVEADTDDNFDQQFEVNLRAPYALTRSLIPHLRNNGRIINISSSVVKRTHPNYTIYAMSKAALESFTTALAKHLGARGITVNCVVPGVTDTDMNGSWLTEAARARVAALTPLGRIGQPDDIADVVAFLASEEARWVTNQFVDATGGIGL